MKEGIKKLQKIELIRKDLNLNNSTLLIRAHPPLLQTT